MWSRCPCVMNALIYAYSLQPNNIRREVIDAWIITARKQKALICDDNLIIIFDGVHILTNSHFAHATNRNNPKLWLTAANRFGCIFTHCSPRIRYKPACLSIKCCEALRFFILARSSLSSKNLTLTVVVLFKTALLLFFDCGRLLASSFAVASRHDPLLLYSFFITI